MKLRKTGEYFLALMLVMCLVFTSINTTAYAEVDLGSWTTKTNMPTARYGLGVAEANSKIYAIGGYKSTTFTNTTEEYNPETNEWTTKASMPTARRSLGVVETNNKIYAIGGYSGSGISNRVEVYDIETDQWTTKASMLTARQSLGIVAVNNKIYAIGGYTPSGSTNVVEEYDPATNKWTTKAILPTARYDLGVVVVNNKIYAIGGYAGSVETNIVEEYDPATDTWTTKTSMPTARYGLGVAEVNNQIYAMGGIANSVSSGIVETYDPITDQWEVVASMPTTRHRLGVAAVNNKIYAIGGSSSTSGYLNTVSEFTPPKSKTLALDIEATSYEVKMGLQFDVYARIYGATSIYAEDINISYDANLFELINAEPVNPDSLGIHHSDHSTPGQARYIVASKGAANVINGTSQLLKLTFKVKVIEGVGDISISSGLVANGEGTELTPICLGKTFTITGLAGDVNNDKRYSLGDLAIAAKLLNTMPDSWGTYQPDVNMNGTVEDIDLVAIVESILNGVTS